MAVVSYKHYRSRNLAVMNGVKDDGIENGKFRIGRNFVRGRRRLVLPDAARRSQANQKYNRDQATRMSVTN